MPVNAPRPGKAELVSVNSLKCEERRTRREESIRGPRIFAQIEMHTHIHLVERVLRRLPTPILIWGSRAQIGYFDDCGLPIGRVARRVWVSVRCDGEAPPARIACPFSPCSAERELVHGCCVALRGVPTCRGATASITGEGGVARRRLDIPTRGGTPGARGAGGASGASGASGARDGRGGRGRRVTLMGVASDTVGLVGAP